MDSRADRLWSVTPLVLNMGMSATVIDTAEGQPSGWTPPDDDHVWTDAPHPAGPGSRPARRAGPVDELIRLLESADQIMAAAIRVLRASRGTGQAERQSGLPVERLVSLATGRTGTDVRFLSRAERTLAHLPTIDLAFAQGRLSWSQVRGIVTAAKGLRVAQMVEFDTELGAEIGQGEPDRIVQRAFGWADLILSEDDAEQIETDPGDRKSFRVQPDLFGGAAYYGYDRLDAVSAIWEAANAAADQPVKANEVRLDLDGTPVPADLLPTTARQAQLAEGLRRVAATYLAGGVYASPVDATHAEGPSADADQPGDAPLTPGDRSPARPHEQADWAARSGQQARALPNGAEQTGSPVASNAPGRRATRPPRPSISIVLDHTDLLGATGRALVRWNGGPIRLTRLTTERLLCDPQLTPVITDSGRPVAVGDATSPITRRHYRTLEAIDRGCRLPGCNAPPQHCDAHHIVPRQNGGETSTDNLALVCRDCHSRIHSHRLDVQLNRHTRAVTLTLSDGRTYTSLPA